jgi:hypothetical protein
MKYYKPSLNSRKQHSLAYNFIVSNTLPDLSHVLPKASSGMRTRRDRAQRSSLHPQPGEGNTCSNQSRTGHLQQVGNKP